MGDDILEQALPNLIIAVNFFSTSLDLSIKLNLNLFLDQIYAILLLKNISVNFKALGFSNKRQKLIKKTIEFISSAEHKTENRIIEIKKIWSHYVDKPENKDDLQYQFFTLIALLMGYINLSIAQELLEFFKDHKLMRFMIDGNDLKSLGYQGQDIGKNLDNLRRIWIEKDFKISKQELLQCLKNY